ncbi:hypothetical protein KBC79_00180 [Candidatus Woesebacteria bacterium]|nr:hypothetical protein [Candidatus Woesebacteria bacterium]
MNNAAYNARLKKWLVTGVLAIIVAIIVWLIVWFVGAVVAGLVMATASTAVMSTFQLAEYLPYVAAGSTAFLVFWGVMMWTAVDFIISCFILAIVFIIVGAIVLSTLAYRFMKK